MILAGIQAIVINPAGQILRGPVGMVFPRRKVLLYHPGYFLTQLIINRQAHIGCLGQGELKGG